MILNILFLAALPMCLAQFSIQGPSDGNRRAQGLKYSSEKGIEYTDQNESLGVGDFTIQGATDGHSNFDIQGATDSRTDFNIQGASDGHSNFQIQGASDGGAARFHIQGATDGHSQSVIQGPYDPNSHGPGKSLEYNDPSGLRVNWRSYDRRQPAQANPQYVEPVAPARPQAAAPRRHQAQHAPQPQPQAQPVSQPIYRSFDNAPPHLKEILQFQQQIPYLNIIPQQIRYDALADGQQQQQYQQQSQDRPETPYRSKQRPSSRPRRQAPQHQSQQRQQGAAAPQYRRLSQPPAEPQVQYNPNVPANLKELLKYQTQIPYVNVIPEQYRFDADAAVREQATQVHAYLRDLAREAASGAQQQRRPVSAPSPAHSRQRRQAQQQSAHGQPQYRRISQPPTETQPSYSANLPNSIQELLKFQAQIPYNILANQVTYRVDKNYVPQAVESPVPAQAQYQPTAPASAQYQSAAPAQPQYQSAAPAQPQYQHLASAQPQYQPTAPAQAQYQPAPASSQSQYQSQHQPNSPLYRSPSNDYQGLSSGYQAQSSGYTQGHFVPEPRYSQLQSGYGQSSGVRPVTENQY